MVYWPEYWRWTWILSLEFDLEEQASLSSALENHSDLSLHEQKETQTASFTNKTVIFTAKLYALE